MTDAAALPRRTDPSSAPTIVFIVSYGRPLYLWNCLDSLYRNTRSPARFVLVDNWHPDRQVDEVIRAFERRGLFHDVHRFTTNRVDNLWAVYEKIVKPLADPEHVVIESDVCLLGNGDSCWLAEMRRIFRANPGIGMLGGLIDPDDFVPEARARAVVGTATNDVAFLAKLDSPERAFLSDRSWERTDRDFFPTEPPCPISNPPGRLLMLDTQAVREIGLHADSELARRFRLRGMHPALTPKVRYRHLSLTNIYDYPEYSAAGREAFFRSFKQPSPDRTA